MLNEIVKSKSKVKNPDEILNELESKINDALASKQYDTQSKDGMDVSLCCFDLEKQTVKYAGALRPLVIINDNGIKEIKGDRFPIGGGSSYDKTPFSLHEFKLNKGDSFFMYSDGYPDQFGGPKGKKYMNKKFKSLLDQNRKLSPKRQVINLENELINWQGKSEQIDDILVIGVLF